MKNNNFFSWGFDVNQTTSDTSDSSSESNNKSFFEVSYRMFVETVFYVIVFYIMSFVVEFMASSFFVVSPDSNIIPIFNVLTNVLSNLFYIFIFAVIISIFIHIIEIKNILFG